MRLNVVLASMKVSGGTLEALHLMQDARASSRVNQCHAWTLWASPTPVTGHGLPEIALSRWSARAASAVLQLPFLMWRFWRAARTEPADSTRWLFTHYATLPLSWLVPSRSCGFFVQDLEWNFAGHPLLSRVLRRLILASYRRGKVISANRYLSDRLATEGLNVAAQCSIWADEAFASEGQESRDVDAVMVLRKGAHKRMDLYLELIRRLRGRRPAIRLAVLTTEDAIARHVHGSVDHVLLRPSLDEMRAMYGRSRVFLHLSEHEGFGLPPLESMGSGCVPLCRDSGGVRAYMVDELTELLVPLSATVDDLCIAFERVAKCPQSWLRYSGAARRVFAVGLSQTRHRGEALVGALET